MLPTPCHIISDVHLGAAAPDVERRLLSYLRALPESAASLVINGDLFDFWFEWRRVIPRAAFRVVAELARLRELSVPVVWVAGNHDCWGGDFLREDVGVDYRLEPWVGRIGPWRTRIEHGDGLRPVADRPYRRLRAVLRNPLSIRAFRLLHPDLGAALASGSAHASRSYRPADGGAELSGIGIRQLDDAGDLDLLVFGHSHASSLTRTPGGGVFANAGSWLERPECLVVTDERIRLLPVDESGRVLAEGHSLHRIDAGAQEASAQGEHLVGGVGGDEAVPHDDA